MNKINVSIIAAPRAAMQECIDLIEELPEIHVVAMPSGLSGQATWTALANSDVVIVDERIIEQEGFASLQLLIESYPRLKCLVLMNKYNQNKMIWTLLRGVRGVMCAQEVPRLLPKAIRKLHLGEVWMSRGLVVPLRHALGSGKAQPHVHADQADSRQWMKMH